MFEKYDTGQINVTQMRNGLIKELRDFSPERIDRAIRLVSDSKQRDFTTLLRGLKILKREKESNFTKEQMRNALDNANDIYSSRNKSSIVFGENENDLSQNKKINRKDLEKLQDSVRMYLKGYIDLAELKEILINHKINPNNPIIDKLLKSSETNDILYNKIMFQILKIKNM